MRIFNEDKTKEITQNKVDHKKFKLVEDKLFIKHHEATEFKPQKSHYEVIAEYENGGKDVKEVIDEPQVDAREAYDEYEDILRLEPLNETELLNMELSELYAWFDEYDNQVKQYNRCQRLGIAYDKDIKELDNQAKANAERITEIRGLLRKE